MSGPGGGGSKTQWARLRAWVLRVHCTMPATATVQHALAIAEQEWPALELSPTVHPWGSVVDGALYVRTRGARDQRWRRVI